MSGWNGRKVLVTGAAGFVGSTLCERLVLEGAEVRAFVRYNSRNQHGWIESFDEATRGQLEIFAGDLKDPEAVRRAVTGREIVFHLGALIAIPYSYLNPLDFVQTNVLGTAHVLDACRVCGVERLVHTSTSETYGTAQYVPIDEKHPAVGQSPYAASKIAADQLAESYHRSFGVPLAIARPFNTYGPRQSARAVIPSIAIQCLAGREVKLGSLHPTRDLSFVADTVDGFLRIATTEAALGEAINLGTGLEIEIGALAEKIRELSGTTARIVHDATRARPQRSEVDRLCCDNGKARRLLGWEPRVSLENGLVQTLSWLEKHTSLYKPAEYNL